jgi:hypothetical protein
VNKGTDIEPVCIFYKFESKEHNMSTATLIDKVSRKKQRKPREDTRSVVTDSAGVAVVFLPIVRWIIDDTLVVLDALGRQYCTRVASAIVPRGGKLCLIARVVEKNDFIAWVELEDGQKMQIVI